MAKKNQKEFDALAKKLLNLPRLTDRELQVLQQIMVKVDACLDQLRTDVIASSPNFLELSSYSYAYLHWKRQQMKSTTLEDRKIEPHMMMLFGMFAEREGWLKEINFNPEIPKGLTNQKNHEKIKIEREIHRKR